MPERIRYTWGQSALGEFIVAASERGVVAFEFADRRETALEALRPRLPEAFLEQDDEGLSALAARLQALIDRPDDAHDVAIDPRGDDYQKTVWSLLRQIPAGETTTYGALAARLGTRDARDVTAAIAANAIAVLIPCHRVVKKNGGLSGYRWGAKRKRALLERERRAACFQLA
ncbi:methylated-DNA--[protein]-cysteine S-methyltransferase [Enhydrobacter sp.]|uniref:methylated-DNA--[protein]-cysteine S-methyltransferase n=1 Tax=Enhydrobacter sp. TaxID=1894999 RepID=UPI0026332918|nr:methylated-DNA--[protein]-cysteine S-methyltransferase [Enhydrobacter sp.]WIM10510.1 MAG: methylated-DNA--[protein]-cysteine S-methyltransferase [Enhydrobacter sp.]